MDRELLFAPRLVGGAETLDRANVTLLRDLDSLRGLRVDAFGTIWEVGCVMLVVVTGGDDRVEAPPWLAGVFGCTDGQLRFMGPACAISISFSRTASLLSFVCIEPAENARRG